MSVPEPHVTITRYDVSCLPLDDIHRDLFGLTVEYREGGKWAVKRGSWCYDAAGERDYASIPEEGREEWLARFRHSLPDALALAKRIAPTLRTNGFTVEEALTWEETE